jgi:hypothetical protein
MGTRYHYDRHGNYRGKTTDTPPSNGDGCVTIILVIAAFCLFCGGC